MPPTLIAILIDFDPNLVEVGNLNITWYGFLFTLGFVISRFIVKYMFQEEGRWRVKSDILLIYMIAGTVIGARIGHVLFYDPLFYLSNPMAILKIWEGGLSSHGTSVGILLGVAAYCYHWDFGKWKFQRTKREGYSYLQIIDRMVIVVAFGGCFIRVGNFINAEAIGKPTNMQVGVVHTLPIKRELQNHLGSIERIESTLNDSILDLTVHFPARITSKTVVERYNEYIVIRQLQNQCTGDDATLKNILFTSVEQSNDHFVIQARVIPQIRHPTQLYEAAGYLLLFLYLFSLWKRYKLKITTGRIFSVFLIALFGSRIIWEILKVESSVFQIEMITIGQILSVPFLVWGIVLFYQTNRIKS